MPLRLLLGALLGALALAGCAGIPTRSPVRAGVGGASASGAPAFRVAPLGPLSGASPTDVVRGFYLAGVGVDDDFAAARQFLSPPRRAGWRPTQHTIVHALGALSIGAATPVAASAGTARAEVAVPVSAPVTGEVDASGTYTPAAAGVTERFVLHLARSGGQWRITDAPDLIMLDEPDFERVFAPVPLYFPARSDGVMVPEVRWVLDRSSIATTVTADLLAGPSAALAPAVSPGAPTTWGLGTTGSVVVAAGSAAVDLPARYGALPAAGLRALHAQLVATLGALPGVGAVRVSVDGGALPSPAAPVVLTTGAVTSARADASDPASVRAATDLLPVVVDTGGKLARLVGAATVPVSGLAALPAGASDPAQLSGQVTALAPDRSALLSVTATRVTTTPVGADLTAPSLDRFGWTWSTPARSSGAVSALSRSGRLVAVEAAWLAGRTVLALRIAPDATQALVVSTAADGSGTRVDVVGVRRDGAGAPARLVAPAGAPAGAAPWAAAVAGASWIGDDRLALLATSAPGSPAAGADPASTTAPSVWVVTAGHPVPLGAPTGTAARTVSLTAGSSDRSVLLATDDGRLWGLEGVDWLPTGATGTDPAYPG